MNEAYKGSGGSEPYGDAEMYRSRGFANRVGFGVRPALLVVDLIRGFTDPASPLGSDLNEVVDSTRLLLEDARTGGVPIHFTTTAYSEGFADAGVFIMKVPSLGVLRVGDPLTEVDERLGPRPGEHVWLKKYASAFFGTALAATLTAARADTLIIAGCTTSGCVRASAVDGCQHGFRTIVVRECVGDRSSAQHEANLFDLDAKYADVVPLSEAREYLRNLEQR